MRLSELIHKPVVDVNGVKLGFLQDVRMQQDGPILGTWGAAFRASSLLIVPHKWLSQLGWEAEHTCGPWVIRALTSLLNRKALRVPWTAVANCDGPTVQLNIAQADIKNVE